MDKENRMSNWARNWRKAILTLLNRAGGKEDWRLRLRFVFCVLRETMRDDYVYETGIRDLFYMVK
jgi:hypothetical protein